MATYYIDPTGDDTTGNGSIGTPWKTLYKASTTVTTGNTIHVNAGTYTENTQIPLAAGVNLEGDGDTSIITSTSFGSEGQYLINMRSVSLVNGNQSISYLKFDGNDQTVSRCLDILKRHNVKIHHCTFVDFKYEGIVWGGDGTGNVGTDPPGYDEDTPPTVYVTGSEFHDNTMTSCSLYDSYGHGSLCLGGHEGMLIYNNNIECLTRISGSPGYCIKTQYPGFMRGMKIYNNTLKTANNTWLFAIEGFFFYGCEFYNNTIVGAIDINGTNKGAAPVYDYGAWIHDNTIGPATYTSGYAGGIFEFNTSDVIIERNLIKNCGYGLEFTPRTNCTVQDYQIRYNIFQNCNTRIFECGTSSGTFYFDDFYVYNNVLHGTAIWGIEMWGICNKFYFRNNIITGTTYYWLGFRNTSAASDSIFIENNILYNNASSNGVFFEMEATNYFNSDNLTSNPLFTNLGSDFTLQSDSPAIDAGLDVGLSLDFRKYRVPYGIAPDIGAYEYGSSYAGAIDSASVNHLAFGGAHIGQTGKLTRAYNFTTNDYIGDLTARVSALELTSAISISAWFKTSVSDSAYHTVVSNYSVDYGYVLSMNSSYQIEWLVGNGTTTGVKTTTATYNDNAWHHVVATFDGINVMIYLDGVAVGSPVTWNNNIAYSAGCRYIVGARNNAGSGERFWEGMIDEVAVYSRELQLGDVEDLYNSGSGVTYPFY